MTPRGIFSTTAIVGGGAGSLLMDLTQYAWAAAFERRRPSDDQDEETEAITAVFALLGRLAPGAFPKENAETIGRAIHYLFGIGFAAAYFALLPNRRPAFVRGAAFGIVLWLISDRIFIPLFKLGRPWSRYSVSERSNALASHLAYALTVEFARRPKSATR
jgi:uncharacterized membrane protein YagU involved in acid resistance